MSKHRFSISNEDTSELDSNKELYRWYHDYLPPIATLFNAKLGDQSGDAVSFSTDFEPLPETLEDALLNPGEQAALQELMAEGSDDSNRTEEDLAQSALEHPAFSDEANVSFGLGGSGYDRQTGVPSAEVPSLRYRIERGAFTTFNGRVTKRLEENKPKLHGPADYQALYDEYLADSKKFGRFGEKVLGFEGFPDLYASDEWFGWQRVAGTNPRVLMGLDTARLETLLNKMPLTDAHLQAVAGADATLAAEAHAARLYYCDYALLEGLEIQQGRYLAPAIGVFWSDVEGKQLRPVAIQLQQAPGRIHLPSEADWPSARAMFQVADFNYHEMGTHLSEAHFGQEAFVVAARRTLSPNHPVGALLHQIYWALLYNNALGRLQLVNPGGYADKMMAGDLDKGSLEIVRRHFVQVWHWDHWDLDRYLAAQGTSNTAGLPVYPYRDDGLPLWAAIKTFASEYVAAWYERDAVVANDRQVEHFIAELNDPEKGNLSVKGFPAAVTTCEGLASVLARLIWQAGPGHAGINYSQYQYFAPISNSPGSGYADCNVPAGQPLPALMDVLPPIEQAITQSDILNVLTQKVFGRLGVYDDDFLDGLDEDASAAVKKFQAALKHCATTVDRHNDGDARKNRNYLWLHPNNLPNSTNI